MLISSLRSPAQGSWAQSLRTKLWMLARQEVTFSLCITNRMILRISLFLSFAMSCFLMISVNLMGRCRKYNFFYIKIFDIVWQNWQKTMRFAFSDIWSKSITKKISLIISIMYMYNKVMNIQELWISMVLKMQLYTCDSQTPLWVDSGWWSMTPLPTKLLVASHTSNWWHSHSAYRGTDCKMEQPTCQSKELD